MSAFPPPTHTHGCGGPIGFRFRQKRGSLVNLMIIFSHVFSFNMKDHLISLSYLPIKRMGAFWEWVWIRVCVGGWRPRMLTTHTLPARLSLTLTGFTPPSLAPPPPAPPPVSFKQGMWFLHSNTRGVQRGKQQRDLVLLLPWWWLILHHPNITYLGVGMGGGLFMLNLCHFTGKTGLNIHEHLPYSNNKGDHTPQRTVYTAEWSYL